MTELNLFVDQLFTFLYNTTAVMNVTCDHAFFFFSDDEGKEKRKASDTFIELTVIRPLISIIKGVAELLNRYL